VFELARSSDLSKMGKLGQARAKTLSVSHDRAGSFEFDFPLAHDFSSSILEIETCVLVKKAERIVWSGPVWTVVESTPDSMHVGCVGWLQTLEKRVTKPAWGTPLSYTAQDAGVIALDLLTKSNADTSYVDYVLPGTSETSQSRTKVYQPYSSVLNEIIALSDLESGYDFLVDPATRRLNIYARLGTTQPEAYFEYGGNATSVSRTCDSARLSNRIIAYSSIGAVQVDDVDSQSRYGVFEEAISLSDVRDTSILLAYANAELAVRSTPLRFHSFSPRQGPSVPRLFEDFDVGDTCYVTARRGRLQVLKQAVRIFGATVTWPDEGSDQEQITSIQTTVSG